MDLHKIPEIGYREFETKRYIMSALSKLDCKIFEMGETGVVAFFDFGKAQTVGIRADMDALPIKEDTGLSFASTREGYMHACGHDGHMAMALAAAAYVDGAKKQGKSFNRNAAFVFQPAEELDGGARHIVADGILQRLCVSRMFGIHLWPGLPQGEVFSKSGPMMARSCETDITVYGKACHIADGNKGQDSLRASVWLLQKLYGLEEQCNRTQRCLLKFGKMQSGSLRNIISDITVINGSTRALTEQMFARLKEGAQAAVDETAREFGVKIDLRMSDGYPPVINDEALFAETEACGVKTLDDAVMQAEDFSFYGKVCPTVFFFLGVGDGKKLHNEKFDFDMSVLDSGVGLYKKLLDL